MANVVFTKAASGERLRVVGDDVRVLTTSADTAGELEIFDVNGPKDSGPPPHAHPWSESYFIQSGEVDVFVDGQRSLLQAGDFVFIPAGILHGYRIASEHASFVVTTGAGRASKLFRELDAVADAEVSVIVGVALKNGLTVPPPPRA
jgi:quercetin dioxygenase-like cupin family protein